MAEVRCLLVDHRLITLTGVGGAGKTRLAIQVATDDRSRFPDGAWMVELGALRDPAAIPAEVATALDVVAAPGQSLMGRAFEFLSDRRALVILDNCEHLLDDTAQVVGGLLRACPHLAVLATSRELLSVPGEQAYRVRSLDLTASPGRPSAAARLFEERARADRADLRLDDAEGAVVERICARLGGMPLAIELAAARARSMGVVEIAARLDERFRLLGGGVRGRVERHRTLRATVQWSYGLLSPAERDLFDRLSVFASTFDLDAAVAVGDAGDIDEFDVLDRLDSLVAKSMVGVEIHPRLGTRYRLFETLRAFGQDRLDTAGAVHAVCSEHAAYYRTRALSSTQEFWGPDAVRVASRVLADAPEYRAAVAWLASTGRLDDALAIAATHVWVASEWDWWEPHDWLRELLADPAAAGCRHRSAATAALAATTLWHDADPVEAERLATAALRTRDDPGQAPDSHAAEFTLSFLAMIQGQPELSVQWSKRLIEASRTDGDPNVHSAMFMAAAALAQLGRTQEARALVGELKRYYQAHPWAGADYVINHTLGFITMESDPDLARHHFEEASRVGRATGCPFWTRNATVETMSLLVAHGPIREAAVGAGEVIGSLWEGRDMGNVPGRSPSASCSAYGPVATSRAPASTAGSAGEAGPWSPATWPATNAPAPIAAPRCCVGVIAGAEGRGEFSEALSVAVVPVRGEPPMEHAEHRPGQGTGKCRGRFEGDLGGAQAGEVPVPAVAAHCQTSSMSGLHVSRLAERATGTARTVSATAESLPLVTVGGGCSVRPVGFPGGR
jgi:predicted ATPase